MSTDTIKPFQGPPATPNNFADAHPELKSAITEPVKRGVNLLDPESQANLEAVKAMMRSNPAKPATVVNLHPWPLSFGYGNPLLRGITIPPCMPGQIYSHAYIRVQRYDKFLTDNGSYNYKPILPITIASEFLREFSNRDNDGGGVIIYEGEINPDKVKEIELYDPMGRPITRTVQRWEWDEENNKIPVTGYEPIKGDFQKILKEALTLRNQVYLRKVQAADHDYNLPDGRGRRNITDKHLLMAQVLHADGILRELPKWNLAPTEQEELDMGRCPACDVVRKGKGYKCHNCGHILDPLAAFKAAAIPYGDMSLTLLTVDEMEEVEEIQAEREENRRKFEAKRAKANKGKGASGKASEQGETKD